jgi:hypothetical protein
MRNTADMTGGKPINVRSQSISGLSAVDPLVAFYDIDGGKEGAILFFPGHLIRPFVLIIKNIMYSISHL